MFKLKILLGLFGFSLLIILAIAMTAKVEKVIKLTTFEKAYSITSLYQEDDYFNISLYINQKDSNLNNRDSFSKAYITDFDQANLMKIELLEIEVTGEFIYIDKERFYLYNFHFITNFKTEGDYDLIVPKAYLLLETKQNFLYKLAIGSFSFYKVSEFGTSNLVVSKLRGIVNVIDGAKRLVALEIGLRSTVYKNIIISNIIILDGNLSIYDYLDTTGMKIHPSDNIQEIIGIPYDIYDIQNNDIEFIQLDIMENRSFLFLLKYQQNLLVNRFGFLIEMMIEGTKTYFYYDDFTFFTNYEITQYDKSSLIIYNYENH